MIVGLHQEKIFFVLRNLSASSLKDARAGTYTRLDKLGLNTGKARKVYLKDIPFPVVVTPKVFKDGEAILAYSRIKHLKIAQNNNHYAINRKLWITVNQASYKTYLKMKN